MAECSRVTTSSCLFLFDRKRRRQLIVEGDDNLSKNRSGSGAYWRYQPQRLLTSSLVFGGGVKVQTAIEDGTVFYA